jgi:hypothetical protein
MWFKDLEGPALEAYRNMVAELKRRAMQELNLPENDIVVRPLRPNDCVNLNSGSTSDWMLGQTAVSWEPVVDGKTIADNTFIGINGIMVGASTVGGIVTTAGQQIKGKYPILAQVRVTAKGNLKRYWYVEPINNWENFTGWCDDPVIADQNTVLTVETWGRTAGSITNWGLIGAVAEKRGLLINP